jgi:endonuclease YncB( thermonuclease family)
MTVDEGHQNPRKESTMRRPLRLAFVVLFALPGVNFAAKPEPYTLTGKVVKIADGDTLTVLDASKTQHKIRLAGIDAPEKGQAFGTKARENLAAKVFGQNVLAALSGVVRDAREPQGAVVTSALEVLVQQLFKD